MAATRQKVVAEFHDVSEEALIAFVDRILARDDEAVQEALLALEPVSGVPGNIAQRLLTGRRAEEFFVRHSAEILSIPRERIVDLRDHARGYDFGDAENASTAVEVKGLSGPRGQILFTDREWKEAARRAEDYWLVVVGNLDAIPLARAFRNPSDVLEAACVFRRSVTASWRFTVAVA